MPSHNKQIWSCNECEGSNLYDQWREDGERVVKIKRQKVSESSQSAVLCVHAVVVGRQCLFGDERFASVTRPDQEIQKVDLGLRAHRG